MSVSNKNFKFYTALLFVVTLVLVAQDLRTVGVTWDEPEAHFMASNLIIDWIAESVSRIRSGNWAGVFSPELFQTYWPPSTRETQAHLGFNDHPPLSRYLPALTWWLFHNVFGDVESYRLSSAFLFASLVAGVFWVMSKEIGVASGLFAGISLILMPRVFGHAHIAATDMPMTVFWFFSVTSFYRAIQGEKRWCFYFSIFLGLAWLVKFTGFLIPVALILYALFCREARAWVALRPAFWLSPLLVWILNPTWWQNPIQLFYQNFFKLYLTRQEFAPIRTYYLGKIYSFDLPWHHSFILTLSTIPLTILICALIAVAIHLKRWRQPGLITLFLWQLIWFYFVLVLPFTPNHDGVRLFLPVFPFWACFSGIGFKMLLDWVRRWIRNKSGRQEESYGIPVALILILLSPPLFHLNKIRPFYLESFNVLVGGIKGARELGFETTYWLDTISEEVRKEINRLPDFSSVVVFPGHLNYFNFLKDRGLIKKTLTFKNDSGRYLILIPRQGIFKPSIWAVYLREIPLFTASVDNVPMVLIYELQGK